jgi:signal transduction histidine kinase
MNGYSDSGEDGESLEQAADTVQQVISILRSICGELRPPALAPFGLQKAIEGHLEQVIEAHPELEVQADLMPDGQELPERLRLALYRIYQHAVSNVLRHSGAQHLYVNFTFNEEQVVLEIQDDGCGFVLPERWVDLAREGHLGIVGTAERAESLGGDLNIISQPGKGTLIRVNVPRKGGQGRFSRRGFVIARPGNPSI